MTKNPITPINPIRPIMPINPISLIGLISLIFPGQAMAQQQWTLNQCQDYAIEHSISVKQRERALEKQEYVLSTARNSRLPNLTGSVGENLSFGRSLTAANTYEKTNTTSTSLNLSTNVPLFTGFEIPENIKLNRLNLEALTQDLEKAKNDIRMSVAQAYVQILYNQEMVAVANRQIEIDSMQVKRLQAFVDNGKASVSELAQQQATLASGRLTATEAHSRYRISLLTLTQLLELPTPEGFSIAVPTEEQMRRATDISFANPETVYAEALAVKPEIQAEQLRLQGTEHSIRIAQAGYYPKLNFQAGLGSNYYTTSKNSSDPFGKQLRNNFNQYLGLNLSIPIFSRFAVRNSVRQARIDRETRELTLEQTKKTLYKEIQQVYYNAVNAQSKEKSARQALAASEEAFRLMQAKYENGKANITEFNEAKVKYLKAESDCVQARYELLYQRALIDFYRGKPLEF